jgi:hypothetical protein
MTISVVAIVFHKSKSAMLVHRQLQTNARFKVVMAIKIQVVVFGVVTSSSEVVEYYHFRGPCYLYHKGEVN